MSVARELEPGRAWLESLPVSAATEVASALAALPRVCGAAGDDLPVVIAAWTLAEPTVAAQLLEDWLATADAAGMLNPPSPVAARLAEHIAEALPDADAEAFMARILPQLAKYLDPLFERYDLRGTGLPFWPSAEEAWFPAEFAQGRFTVDLAVLLANEAASFIRLAAGSSDSEMMRVADIAEGERRELADWLQTSFWDEESSAFDRVEANGEVQPDTSVCGFVPLIWDGRTEEMDAGLRARLPAMLAIQWPPRALCLFFAMLMRTPHHSVVARMRGVRFPATDAPKLQAAWTILTAGADQLRREHLKDIPRMVRWLDARGRMVIRVLVAGGALVSLWLLAWGLVHREKPAGVDGRELERKARLACAEGRHDRAAVMYGQAFRRTGSEYYRYRQAGEWMHQGYYAEAEAAYRELLAQNPGAPNVRWNLALATLNQGRREEARELFQALADASVAAEYPELAARARRAVAWIEEQLTLDGWSAPAPANVDKQADAVE